MTRYRYDVVLHLDTETVPASARTVAWTGGEPAALLDGSPVVVDLHPQRPGARRRGDRGAALRRGHGHRRRR